MNLILDPLNLDYKDLLKFLVCNPGNKHGMIDQCPNCKKQVVAIRTGRFPVQIPLGARLGLGTQPHYQAPGYLRVKIGQTQ